MDYCPILPIVILNCLAAAVATVELYVSRDERRSRESIPFFCHKAKHRKGKQLAASHQHHTHIGIAHTPSRAARTSTRRQSQSTAIVGARQAIVLHSQDETGQDRTR
jgi:hypothetical protein